jgi:uncharacterized protein (TIGR04222 family)
MDFLSDNPLANMRGPDFLALYAIFACIAVFTFIALASLDDDGRDAPSRQIPAKPDPYELAYLRDGAGGVVWLAIYALKRAGLVELTKGGKLQRLEGAGPSNRYEADVLNAVGPGSTPSAIIRAPGGAVSSLLRTLESSLAARGLVRSPESRRRTAGLAWWVGGALFAIAGYKVIVATAHGHRNVGGLFIECGIAMLILLLAARFILRQRANTRGRLYLDRVKLAYERPRPNSAGAGLDPVNMLLVGVYGFQVLTGTPDAAFAKQAQMAQSSGGCGGGSSCSGGGGSGCGGGGGCGGCGSS